MPRTLIAAQEITRDGLNPAYAAPDAVNGNQFAFSDRVFLHAKNGAGAPITVTIITPGTVDGLAVPDRAVVVPAGGERMIGPFTAAAYRQADGNVYVDWSSAASVTVALLKAP